MRRFFGMLTYSLIAATCMAFFILLSGPIKFIFSLAAVVVGARFFQFYQGKGLRIGFFAIALVMSLVIPLIYVTLAFLNGWPVDPKFINGGVS